MINFQNVERVLSLILSQRHGVEVRVRLSEKKEESKNDKNQN